MYPPEIRIKLKYQINFKYQLSMSHTFVHESFVILQQNMEATQPCALKNTLSICRLNYFMDGTVSLRWLSNRVSLPLTRGAITESNNDK